MSVIFAKTDRTTAIMAFLFLLSAVCWAGGNKETDVKPTSYWTGDGGKGLSLTITS